MPPLATCPRLANDPNRNAIHFLCSSGGGGMLMEDGYTCFFFFFFCPFASSFALMWPRRKRPTTLDQNEWQTWLHNIILFIINQTRMQLSWRENMLLALIWQVDHFLSSIEINFQPDGYGYDGFIVVIASNPWLIEYPFFCVWLVIWLRGSISG